eukprot:scaffold251453_cov109-Cyclotella_meneghiniana.AAC.1
MLPYHNASTALQPLDNAPPHKSPTQRPSHDHGHSIRRTCQVSHPSGGNRTGTLGRSARMHGSRN